MTFVAHFFKQKTIEFNELVNYYKFIFTIFYWECNLSPSLDRKIIKISMFFKKHILLYSLLNIVLIIYILLLSHCRSNDFVAYVNVETITVINMFSIFISITPSILHYENFKNLWTELRTVNHQIHELLHHKINFLDFFHSFFLLALPFPFLYSFYLIYAFLRSITNVVNVSSNQFRIIICILKFIQIYIEFHAIFIISLLHFMYKMFAKYVKFAYHLERSNLVFPNVNTTLSNLKYYKEIHYKLWTASRELNTFFGLSVTAFSGQTFFDVSYSIYFMFYYWENEKISWMRLISNIF